MHCLYLLTCLHSSGNLGDATEAPPTTVLNIGQLVSNATPDLAGSSSSSSISSYRKWVRVQGAKIAMLAIQDVPLLDMPDTPPRFKKHASSVVSNPEISPGLTISTSDSFRKWRRVHGKNMAEAIMRNQPLPDIPDTPPRFKSSLGANTNLFPAGGVTSHLDTYRLALKNVADKLEVQGCASFTAVSLATPAVPEKDSVICVVPDDDDDDNDYVIINPASSSVFEPPSHTFSVRKIAHMVKGLSHRRIDKKIRRGRDDFGT